MDSCKKYDEKLLPDMEDFYSNLNMEDIIYAYIYIYDYKHAKRLRKIFKNKTFCCGS